MNVYHIWSEGYQATGESGNATYHGTQVGENFREACISFFKGSSDEHYFSSYSMSYWGCKLFDNESDARRSFG